MIRKTMAADEIAQAASAAEYLIESKLKSCVKSINEAELKSVESALARLDDAVIDLRRKAREIGYLV